MNTAETVAKITAAMNTSELGTARGHDDEGRVCWIAREYEPRTGRPLYTVTWKVLGPGARYYTIPGASYIDLSALVERDEAIGHITCWAPGTF